MKFNQAKLEKYRETQREKLKLESSATQFVARINSKLIEEYTQYIKDNPISRSSRGDLVFNIAVDVMARATFMLLHLLDPLADEITTDNAVLIFSEMVDAAEKEVNKNVQRLKELSK